ncbi:MAG: acyl-CoA dehydrogenase family protein, partial [Magnetovibrio sp.]|nr:acyl-CoA dehydrogenase family protein [Magnetovibrio sp.]
FYRADPGFRKLLDLYLPADLRAHLEPHYDRMGEVAGGRLDELAELSDRHGPVLHARDRFGRDHEWIEYHPAYKEMEKIALHDFGLHAMTNRAGVLGWPEKFPYIAKYGFQYLYVQAEFGIMCPISVTDTSTYLFMRYADDELKARYADRLMSQDMDEVLMGAQFMTEKIGGSDAGAAESVARFDEEADDGTGKKGHWRVTGDKWFCSHADGDLAMILARPEGAPEGSRGLGLFMMPRYLENGEKNAYTIIRLKDKLGTRSMASGEIRMDGAIAYPLGTLENGFKQMLDQVNLSRLSHGVRAAAMMRRCLNESLAVARTRSAFKQRLIDMPLVRRQLLKIMVPAEQSLSMWGATAEALDQAEAGDAKAQQRLRLLTPIYKFRACRDNIEVAANAAEMRGGLGYIEEWINPRLIRDAQIGTLWEGTSNIIGLDVVTRAIAKAGADKDLSEMLKDRIEDADGVPGQFRGELSGLIDRALAFARSAADGAGNTECRRATSALYHTTTAALMAWEAAKTGDGRRLILSRLITDHRLATKDPMAAADDGLGPIAAELLLDREDEVTLDEAKAALAKG